MKCPHCGQEIKIWPVIALTAVLTTLAILLLEAGALSVLLADLRLFKL